MKHLHQALVLDLLPQLGVYRLLKRIKNICPFSLFNLTRSELIVLGFNDEQIKLFHNPPTKKLKTIDHWLAQQSNRTVISYFDDNYPKLLKEISSPPMLLFCQGNDELLHSAQIAMVGSRTATISGKETAKKLANDLAQHGFCITSGLAAGIDSFAHQGALINQGHTVAVLGSGLNVIYPKSNMLLAIKIEQHGLLISEFWPNTPPSASQFPRRNRIVSGLSLGVIVVEAAQRSGSLITARLASEQNREVFAVPGSINNPKVTGCHQLISQGAKLITSAADILDEFPQYQFVIDETPNKHLEVPKAEYDNVLAPILANIGYETTSIDVIAQRCNLSINIVLERLLSLELTGEVTSLSGGYIRNKRET